MLQAYMYLLVIFTVIDAIWLSIASKLIYAKPLAHLMADKPNLIPAVVFYLLYPLAIYVLIFFKSDTDLKTVLIKALMLGITAYATYNLTNASILKNWPTHLVFIDIVWGGIVTTVTALIYFYVINRIQGK